jgi:hypothetical protein
MTHFSDLASEACVIYSNIAKRLLEGEEMQTAIKTEIKNTRYESYSDEEPDCPPDGYVVNTMNWVLYWLLNCKSFEEVVEGPTNMGNDSDTIAAIAGSLKGIEVGYDKLGKYTGIILCRQTLDELANVLYEIRDKDTLLIKENAKEYLLELEEQSTQLFKSIKQKGTPKEQSDLIERIKENIYLLRITLQEEDTDYDKKLITWRMIENRYRRARRLLDLGSPPIIILNELEWLLTMIDHMSKRFNGIEPEFTEDQRNEIEVEALTHQSFVQ